MELRSREEGLGISGFSDNLASKSGKNGRSWEGGLPSGSWSLLHDLSHCLVLPSAIPPVIMNTLEKKDFLKVNNSPFTYSVPEGLVSKRNDLSPVLSPARPKSKTYGPSLPLYLHSFMKTGLEGR